MLSLWELFTVTVSDELLSLDQFASPFVPQTLTRFGIVPTFNREIQCVLDQFKFALEFVLMVTIYFHDIDNFVYYKKDLIYIYTWEFTVTPVRIWLTCFERHSFILSVSYLPLLQGCNRCCCHRFICKSISVLGENRTSGQCPSFTRPPSTAKTHPPNSFNVKTIKCHFTVVGRGASCLCLAVRILMRKRFDRWFILFVPLRLDSCSNSLGLWSSFPHKEDLLPSTKKQILE